MQVQPAQGQTESTTTPHAGPSSRTIPSSSTRPTHAGAGAGATAADAVPAPPPIRTPRLSLDYVAQRREINQRDDLARLQAKQKRDSLPADRTRPSITTSSTLAATSASASTPASAAVSTSATASSKAVDHGVKRKQDGTAIHKPVEKRRRGISPNGNSGLGSTSVSSTNPSSRPAPTTATATATAKPSGSIATPTAPSVTADITRQSSYGYGPSGNRAPWGTPDPISPQVTTPSVLHTSTPSDAPSASTPRRKPYSNIPTVDLTIDSESESESDVDSEAEEIVETSNLPRKANPGRHDQIPQTDLGSTNDPGGPETTVARSEEEADTESTKGYRIEQELRFRPYVVLLEKSSIVDGKQKWLPIDVDGLTAKIHLTWPNGDSNVMYIKDLHHGDRCSYPISDPEASANSPMILMLTGRITYPRLDHTSFTCRFDINSEPSHSSVDPPRKWTVTLEDRQGRLRLILPGVISMVERKIERSDDLDSGIVGLVDSTVDNGAMADSTNRTDYDVQRQILTNELKSKAKELTEYVKTMTKKNEEEEKRKRQEEKNMEKEKKREREMEQEKEKERVKEMEREKHLERAKKMEREKEMERKKEMERRKEIEREAEAEREKQRQNDEKRKWEEEREKETQNEEKKRKREEEKEKEKKEMDKQREVEAAAEKQRQAEEKEREREAERKKERKEARELEKEKMKEAEKRRQNEVQRKTPLIHDTERLDNHEHLSLDRDPDVGSGSRTREDQVDTTHLTTLAITTDTRRQDGRSSHLPTSRICRLALDGLVAILEMNPGEAATGSQLWTLRRMVGRLAKQAEAGLEITGGMEAVAGLSNLSSEDGESLLGPRWPAFIIIARILRCQTRVSIDQRGRSFVGRVPSVLLEMLDNWLRLQRRPGFSTADVKTLDAVKALLAAIAVPSPASPVPSTSVSNHPAGLPIDTRRDINNDPDDRNAASKSFHDNNPPTPAVHDSGSAPSDKDSETLAILSNDEGMDVELSKTVLELDAHETSEDEPMPDATTDHPNPTPVHAEHEMIEIEPVSPASVRLASPNVDALDRASVSQLTLHHDIDGQILRTQPDRGVGEKPMHAYELLFGPDDSSDSDDDDTPSVGEAPPGPVHVVSRWTGRPSVRAIDTRANLIEELDSIYDGGKDRCVMRLHEEETALIAGDISDRERFFTIVWNRYILEHGDISTRQEEYLVGFFNQYGPILHRADACYPVSCHLIRLYREGLLDRSKARHKQQALVERQRRVGLELCLKLTRVWSGMKAKWDKQALANGSTGS